MPGKIVHFELHASDVDRAAGFWNGLFDWNIGGSAMEDFDYRLFRTGEDQGGGLMPSETPGAGPTVYFDTDDIQASIEQVRALGGTAGEKQPVPTHGWFAVCTDTEGTSFNLWQGDESAA
jgi:predicted enzyme related to lactoylglutathione lyase